jgi:hypothetical protein
MKHLKLFESYYDDGNDTFIKIDDVFLVNKFKFMGTLDFTEGQIIIKTRKSIHNNWTTRSLITGIAKLLGTKYENNQKLREIKLPNNTPEVKHQTKNAILKHFLKDYAYDYNKYISRQTLNSIVYPEYTFYSMMSNSLNVGEVIDKMKEFKKNFKIQEDKEFEEWKIKEEAKKFNL